MITPELRIRPIRKETKHMGEITKNKAGLDDDALKSVAGGYGEGGVPIGSISASGVACV